MKLNRCHRSHLFFFYLAKKKKSLALLLYIGLYTESYLHIDRYSCTSAPAPPFFFFVRFLLPSRGFVSASLLSLYRATSTTPPFASCPLLLPAEAYMLDSI